MCTSLAPRPVTVVFGLGSRLGVHMRTTFKNDVLHNRQQPGSAMSSSIGQGELGAVKTFSSYRLNKVVERKRKMALCHRTLLHLAVFCVTFEHLYESS